MNRDTKIGIVVVLIIVGFLVIIWGRGGDPDMGENPELPGLPTNSLDGNRNTEAGNIVDIVTPPSEGTLVVESDVLPGVPDLSGDSVLPPETVNPLPEPTTTEVVRAEPEPVSAPSTWEYTVKAGDVGEVIAREQLGDGRRWGEIAALNAIDRNAVIRIGQKLKMPPKGSTTPAAATASSGTTTRPQVQPANTTAYVVTQFDIGLIQIAEEQLGDAKRWKEIAELNGLAKPYKILVGQRLFLPRQ